MKNAENIKQLISVSPDFIGFIFYEKSKRFVGNDFSTEIIKSIPQHIKKVGVFVNSELNEIIQKIKKYNLDFIQLHGDESAGFCETLSNSGIRIFKVFHVNDAFYFDQCIPFQDWCSYFLFDTGSKEYGGTGIKFNWTIFKNYSIPTPFFLSGGIDLDDIDAIKTLHEKVNFHAVDINSHFELEPGLKEINKIIDFKYKLSVK